jgi:hypothetical protein
MDNPDIIHRGRPAIGRACGGVSPRTVSEWHRRRLIPSFEIRGTIFLRRSAWLEHCRQREQGELPQSTPEQPLRKRGWPKGRPRKPVSEAAS